MKPEIRRCCFALGLCIVALAIAGCASRPNIDGGIVGSGNRVDCAALAKKDGADAPTPEECKP